MAKKEVKLTPLGDNYFVGVEEDTDWFGMTYNETTITHYHGKTYYNQVNVHFRSGWKYIYTKLCSYNKCRKELPKSIVAKAKLLGFEV